MLALYMHACIFNQLHRVLTRAYSDMVSTSRRPLYVRHFTSTITMSQLASRVATCSVFQFLAFYANTVYHWNKWILDCLHKERITCRGTNKHDCRPPPRLNSLKWKFLILDLQFYGQFICLPPIFATRLVETHLVVFVLTNQHKRVKIWPQRWIYLI